MRGGDCGLVHLCAVLVGSGLVVGRVVRVAEVQLLALFGDLTG
jgi:hypothetical protein